MHSSRKAVYMLPLHIIIYENKEMKCNKMRAREKQSRKKTTTRKNKAFVFQ